MKTTAAVLILMALTAMVSAQRKQSGDPIYDTPALQSKKQILYFANNTEKIQYNLGRYYNQRQLAYIVSMAGGVSTIIGINQRLKSEKSNAVLIAGSVFSATGLVIFFDAEKYLKRASISITPLSLKVNF